MIYLKNFNTKKAPKYDSAWFVYASTMTHIRWQKRSRVVLAWVSGVSGEKGEISSPLAP